MYITCRDEVFGWSINFLTSVHCAMIGGVNCNFKLFLGNNVPSRRYIQVQVAPPERQQDILNLLMDSASYLKVPN